MAGTTYIHHYSSQTVGWLELCVSDKGVRSIAFVPRPKTITVVEGHPIVNMLVDELDRYFQGTLSVFTTPLDIDEGTPFQRKVWQQLTLIPYGQTRSYADLAAAIGNPRAARAVGSANGENPIPILLPCHRVIKADGSLGGFSSGTHIKVRLLELEGYRPRG